jgi:hypothetical protein
MAAKTNFAKTHNTPDHDTLVPDPVVQKGFDVTFKTRMLRRAIKALAHELAKVTGRKAPKAVGALR